MANIAQKIERMPFDAIARDMRASLEAAQATLLQTQRTMASANQMLSAGSPLSLEMRRTMIELSDAARALGLAAEQLQQQPESLLFGKEGETK
jgi:paraquat-inducible protein B